jgi:hypothetical protein
MTAPRVMMALIFAILAGFAIWWMMPRPLPEVVICERLVPGVKQVGLKFGRAEGGGVNVDFGGSSTATTASPEALHAFLDCLREQNGQRALILAQGIVDLPLAEPIGEVAEHWKGDADLRLTLIPGGDDKVLNNLRVGPAAGSKRDVIRNWCSAEQAGPCAKCTPDSPDSSSKYVEIELRANPPVERQEMPGPWSGAALGKPLEPWQLVEPDGKRYVYKCSPKRT